MSPYGQHSNEDDFLNYVHVIRLFYVLNMGMPTLSNYDQKRIYDDVMYCKIDAGDHSASSPTHHSVKHLNQMFLLFGSHALGGNFYSSIMTWLIGHHLQDQ